MTPQDTIFDRVAAEALALAPGEQLRVGGLVGAATALAAARALPEEGPGLIVCPDEASADALARALGAFFATGPTPQDQPRVLRLPADELTPYDALSPDPKVGQQRIAALFQLRFELGVRAVVVSCAGLLRRVLPTELLDTHALALAPGETHDRDELVKALVAAGYRSVPLVEDPGTFCQRGGLLDLFSPLYAQPSRIDFFGDEIESLRFFDPTTQRTSEAVDDVFVSPASEILFDETIIRRVSLAVRELGAELGRPTRQLRGLLDELARAQAGFGTEALLPVFYEQGLCPLTDYFPAGTPVIWCDARESQDRVVGMQAHYDREYLAAQERSELVYAPGAYLLDVGALQDCLETRAQIQLDELVVDGGHESGTLLRASQTATSGLRAEIQSASENDNALRPLMDRLRRWRDAGQQVVITCSSAGRRDRLKRLLLGRDLMCKELASPLKAEAPRARYDPGVHAFLLMAELEAGFIDGEAKLVLLPDTEILGPPRGARRKQASSQNETFTERFRELEEGDFVVHVEHGIARYRGLTRLELGGIAGDFLLLEFAGKDKIYLPVQRLSLVQKYVGGAEGQVRLDKLGGQSFSARKKKVREEVLKMAAELLELYATRKAHPGTAFSPPDAIFRSFEDSFPFEETRDQARAIEEVLADMQRSQPMDRLVCGDVGFGKTEVAMRAAMKCVLDGKQVAVLVPTTVLAAQHEASFRERFEKLPVRIEGVSRFRSQKEIRTVFEGCANGQVDVLIGTHRILSKDVGFRDLGLVVVDEEQRFGVKQKEALKKLKRQVDVLTLTATPIPRTLHLSLSGIRDLSIIATPPVDRLAVRTFVTRFDGPTIQEAVRREVGRGGQVFFVHNRVQSIEGVHRYLQELLPEVRIQVAHGQMGGDKLEEAMTRFVERKADLLLCTTIIESGIDMPTVNTILISRADAFGLAQLYQLRGRVGRSRARAYCYLLVPARRPITRDAGKRLAVLQQLSELGSGFRLASHDLEIRGAGNLLGPDQSGEINAVGFDLYAQMLEEAVQELRGEAPKATTLDPEVTLPLPSYLPEYYVQDVHQRLGLYKRAAALHLEDEEAVQGFREELVDRFGPLPEEAEALVRIASLRVRLYRLQVRALEGGPARLVLSLGPQALLDPQRLLTHLERSERGHKGRLKLTPEMRLVLTLRAPLEGEPLFEAAKTFLNEIEKAAALPQRP